MPRNGKLGLVARTLRRVRALHVHYTTKPSYCPACGEFVRLDDRQEVVHGRVYHRACVVPPSVR